MMVEEYACFVHRLSLDLYKRLNLLLFMNGRSTHGLPFKLEFIEGGKAAHFCYHINPPDSRFPAYLFAYYLYFLLIHFRPSLNDSGAHSIPARFFSMSGSLSRRAVSSMRPSGESCRAFIPKPNPTWVPDTKALNSGHLRYRSHTSLNRLPFCAGLPAKATEIWVCANFQVFRINLLQNFSRSSSKTT